MIGRWCGFATVESLRQDLGADDGGFLLIGGGEAANAVGGLEGLDDSCVDSSPVHLVGGVELGTEVPGME